jgi:hydroxymethylglutaryl-CoA lyase
MTRLPNSTEGETRRVHIREVGPRDGFQNEPETIATDDKILLINALGRAGFKRIEVASFVRPDVIPQLSDGVEVLHGIDVPDDVARMVLIPNSRGLDNALGEREYFEEATLFVSASQTHNKRNINRTVEETMADVQVMGKRIVAEDLTFCAVIATSFGCPFEGEVPMGRVLDLAEQFAEAGATEVGFGDTTGMCNPAYSARFFAAAIERLPGVEVTAHFHNTRGQGLANAYAALEAGCNSFESSFGELGGCPVPAGSTGNIATEDLVSMFHEMGVDTGLDLERIIEAAREAQSTLGRKLTSHSIVAGPVIWSPGV